jgi:hypothetical protein
MTFDVPSHGTHAGDLQSRHSEVRLSWFYRRDYSTVIVLGATVLLAVTAISRSFSDGRLANPLTHDDVNFFIEGIQQLTLLRTKGFAAVLEHFVHGSMHAPLQSYQAMLSYLIFGIRDWAPYVSNVVYAGIFLGVSALLVRGAPNIVVAASMAVLMSMPLSSNFLTEYVPETNCSLFTAIAVVLTLRLPLLDAPLWSRFLAGLCFNLGFLFHPSAFAFTTIALLGTIGVVFLRDIFFGGQLAEARRGVLRSVQNLLLSMWLAALYMGPRFTEYWLYFQGAIFHPAPEHFHPLPTHDRLVTSFIGRGGQFMFGDQIWVYAGIILLGIVAAWWRSDRSLLARQAELLPLAFVFWLVPTLASLNTSYLFAQTFGFSIAFLLVMAMWSIYKTMCGPVGAITVLALGILLLLFGHSHVDIPNLPRTLTDRDFAFRAIDRINSDLRGNATELHGVQIHLTNQGAYAPNILMYYLLKTDPMLDWALTVKISPSPEEHVDFIRAMQPEFVIAAQRDNGLTYQQYGQPAEDAVYAAMWQDPNYMAIDRFYGPQGRSVAVFQRRVSFGGWHPIFGISEVSDRRDSARESTGGVTYLGSFAARSSEADLNIECSGTAGQAITVFVNQQRIVRATLAPDGRIALSEQISLVAGMNDIILEYSVPDKVTFNRLLVIPHIPTAE